MEGNLPSVTSIKRGRVKVQTKVHVTPKLVCNITQRCLGGEGLQCVEAKTTTAF